MKIDKALKEFENLPHFPDGRINYKNSSRALVINCFVKFKNKVLLLKRSDKVAAYKNKWNCVGGYLDEPISVEDKAKEEINEELGIEENNILSIYVAPMITIEDKEIMRTWLTFPVLVILKSKPVIKLDWEHIDYRWIRPTEITQYDIILDLDKVLYKLLSI